MSTKVELTANQITAASARTGILWLFWWGFGIVVAGLVIAVMMYPGTSTIRGQATGWPMGYSFALLVCGVGSMLVSMAMVAWAVGLGIRSSRD